MVAKYNLAKASETMMTARQILATPPDELAPASERRYKLVQRSELPKNTIAFDALKDFIFSANISAELKIEILKQSR